MAAGAGLGEHGLAATEGRRVGGQALVAARCVGEAVRLTRFQKELSHERRAGLGRAPMRPAWKHGAFTQAFLDALAGGAVPEGRGVISVPDLVKAMDQDLDHLTKGQQHLGPRVNFLGDVFVASPH